MKNKRYFPLYVDLSDKTVVVVGGGTIATRRVKALLLFTRNITVIAPKMTADLWELGKLGKIKIVFGNGTSIQFFNARPSIPMPLNY